MRVEGRISPPKGRKNKFWGVEIGVLGIYTQGRSQSDAYRMAEDAIESVAGKKSFKVKVHPGKGNAFSVTSDDHAAFLAFALTRLRANHHLSAREVAERLSSSSPNAYARYEQGKAMPKLDKLLELLQAIDPKLSLVLKTA